MPVYNPLFKQNGEFLSTSSLFTVAFIVSRHRSSPDAPLWNFFGHFLSFQIRVGIRCKNSSV